MGDRQCGVRADARWANRLPQPSFGVSPEPGDVDTAAKPTKMPAAAGTPISGDAGEVDMRNPHHCAAENELTEHDTSPPALSLHPRCCGLVPSACISRPIMRTMCARVYHKRRTACVDVIV